MTSREIILRRKKIEAEKLKAESNGRTHRIEQQRLQMVNKDAQDALARGRSERGRGILGIDIAELTEKAQQAQADADAAKAQTDATFETVKQLDRKLKKCLAEHYAIYARSMGLPASRKAEEAVAKANAAITEASQAWAEAQVAWAPLIDAVLMDELKRRPRLNQFPVFPLTAMSAVAFPANAFPDVELS
jgi:hypothetical protein